MRYQKPKGTQDFIPGVVEKWQYVEKKARDWCHRFNYKEIRTPIFEQTELFIRSVGETTDVVEKEMYTFKDKGDRNMALRPEGTAGVVRAYIENKLYGEPDLQKLYYIGPKFRYEQPQSGRFRQFHQFGVEVFGSIDPAIDAEVISLGYSFFKDLGLQGVKVELNSIGNQQSRANYREKLQEFLTPVKEQLCNDCQSRFDRNPLRILDCKKDQQYFGGAPSILDSLDEESMIHFEKVQKYLTEMDVKFEINPRMVRGLDYYTDTVFEYKAKGIGAIDTIAAGGRYNGLVEQIGGQDQPGVGFGIGLERVLLILDHQNVQIPEENLLDVYLVGLGDQAEEKCVKVLYELRQAGIRAEKDYLGKKMKAQLKSADRQKVKYAAILGDEELERGEIVLKTLESREQKTIVLEKFVEEMIKITKGGNM
ncbi:histidine--tRNA ligase [Chengkuizengella sediminis]|uniref:histidine--tRNA ligase n=1 Tax=Chengkuizengella sediminis TaxID=1885917 RepID=UPI00138A314C|nr:histidine--tRNA ligase [Chengkuizengella sediminis]NDI33984.1 histidine--tRNA ligase [Chengkuizengella sediminis]